MPREIQMKNNTKHPKKAKANLKAKPKDRDKFGDIIGKSSPMQKIYSLILEAADSDAGVVLYGESGTGNKTNT